MNGYVYIIRNKINGKIYIGQTYQKLEKRISSHFSRISKPDGAIGRAIQKYGKINFEYYPISVVKSIKKERLIELLNLIENHFIEFYKSDKRKFGYNYKKGGFNESKSCHSEESKKLMSLNKKSFINDNKRQNYRTSKLGKNNPMYNKKGLKSPVSKGVSQFDKKGNHIKDYISATEAGITTNISQKNISCCCTGKLKSAGGYIWKHTLNNNN